MKNKQNLKGLTLPQLEEFFLKIGEKRFRAEQVFLWIYNKKAKSFDEMTNLSKATREKLKELAYIENLEIAQVQVDSESNTHKFLFQLIDGKKIESVLLFGNKRKTVCISSQVGCAVDCGFCATAQMGLFRNLTVSEIIDQLLTIERDFEVKVTNIVFMGMGEPFHNYENVIESAKLMSDEKVTGISQRKITISTSGVLPKIRRFTDENHNFKLAISLNATDNETRTKLMPLNAKWPIEALLEESKFYSEKNRNKITLEYVLLEGINDSIEDAKRFSKWCAEYNCKANVIPYNPTNSDYKRPSKEKIERFMAALGDKYASVTLRDTGGKGIKAACGQLAVEQD
ncbi:MAG: 23S rRNA (adenine(2503)-C(2))-methyltransferase RlmN [Calditrichaeota bacterium]|nr:MAG: 23S rRNA (adenine(2503)-C(2))-methyltransferase RlmN [Calditrichota bacterium]